MCLVLIPVAAIATAAAKQRFADGPNRVFSGGALEAGELHTGAEPDWRFVSEISTIEMQLLDPPKSRRIWTAEYDGNPIAAGIQAKVTLWLHQPSSI